MKLLRDDPINGYTDNNISNLFVLFQDLAGEDMLSAVAYQPRTEVAEVEMMGGVTDETSSGVRENGGRKKAS